MTGPGDTGKNVGQKKGEKPEPPHGTIVTGDQLSDTLTDISGDGGAATVEEEEEDTVVVVSSSRQFHGTRLDYVVQPTRAQEKRGRKKKPKLEVQREVDRVMLRWGQKKDKNGKENEEKGKAEEGEEEEEVEEEDEEGEEKENEGRRGNAERVMPPPPHPQRPQEERSDGGRISIASLLN